MSDEYFRYMSEEWGFEKRGDVPLFEKLCLEGAQAGLSWSTILAKRENYREAFHGFDIGKCAEMSDEELDAIVNGDGGVIRHRGKIEAVRNNARCVLDLARDGEEEPEYGWFDDFIWKYVDYAPVLNEFATMSEMPSKTEVSTQMSKDLKSLGFKFVGPTTCYSLMQSCGLVVDHLRDTPEWLAARDRISQRPAKTHRKKKRKATTTYSS